MIDCRQCKHAVRGYHDTLCTRLKDPRSIDWMRDDYLGECKRAAVMFEAREEKKVEKWIPY